MGAPTLRVTPADGWRRHLIGPHWSYLASDWTEVPECDHNQYDVTVTNWSTMLHKDASDIEKLRISCNKIFNKKKPFVNDPSVVSQKNEMQYIDRRVKEVSLDI